MDIQKGFYLVVLALLACYVRTIVCPDYCNSLVGEVQPHPTTCSQYILCDNGRITRVYTCDPGLVFDPGYGVCVDIAIARPCHPITVDVKVTEVNKDFCRSFGLLQGIYRHPLRCNKFIQCHDGYTSVYTCHVGLLFDTKFNNCNNSDLVGPCSDRVSAFLPVTSGLDTVCEWLKLPEGIYPDPANCDHFVECLDGFTHIVKCPDGLMYNSLSNSCNSPSTVNCSNNNSYSFSKFLV